MDIAYKAMMLAKHLHKDQKRKYTNNPYFDHLAEVAGIASTVFVGSQSAHIAIAVAWLHDSIEDCDQTVASLREALGGCSDAGAVANGVFWLSDIEGGENRAERKAKSRARLAAAPPWVQTIKYADLISNTSSIIQHDPKFAVTYLEEKRLLLDVMRYGDARLYGIAVSNTKE